MMNFLILISLMLLVSCTSFNGISQSVTHNSGGPQLDEAELQKRFFERAR